MNALYDRDADRGKLDGKTIAVIGYGSQGRAHALNLRDSGCDVVVGLRPGPSSAERARADGATTAPVESAVGRADIVIILVPDEEQPALYLRSVAEHLKEGAYLGFAHGFGVHFGTIVPPKSANVFMVAPKGPGRLVRSEYEAGRGVPCLIAVHQDPAGDARSVALAYASAIGGGRAGILETTFREETETDLFGEQAVLCGGVSALVRTGFETLVEAGYAPEMAYFECLHELKLIVDLMYARGINGMREGISNTAEYGDYTRGPRVVGESARDAMREILAEIQQGTFAREWVQEHASGKPRFAAERDRARSHPIESVGQRLRGLMPWMRLDESGRAGNSHDDQELKFPRMLAEGVPGIDDVRAAAAAMAGFVDRTPCVRSHALSELAGAEVFVKFENLQRTGSFKVRGAHTRLARLSDAQRAAGVVAASAGNHAQGVAYHTARMNVPTTIVMPVTTPAMKVRRTQALGARIVLYGATFEEAMARAVASSEEHAMTFIHPYDDSDVIAGQGTVALEMLDAVPDLDAFVVPAGGGGLIAGMAIVATALHPRVELYAARSAAVLSAETSCGVSYLADGIAVAHFGALPQRILASRLFDTISVNDASIAGAMMVSIEHLKTVVEGAAATAVAALLEHRGRFIGKRVGIVLSGGNIDHSRLRTIIGEAA